MVFSANKFVEMTYHKRLMPIVLRKRVKQLRICAIIPFSLLYPGKLQFDVFKKVHHSYLAWMKVVWKFFLQNISLL